MNGFQRPWFLVGGASIELSSGQLTRDHEDLDTAIYHEDLLAFFDYAIQHGYKFTDWKYEEIRSKQELGSIETHALIHKIDLNSSGPKELDIVFLERNKQGQTAPPGDKLFFFPAWLHDNPPHYTTINGQQTPLQPKEIVLFCKITHGRNKDVKETQSAFESLIRDERERFDGYLQSFGISFEIGNQKVTSPDELFKIANDLKDSEKEKFFKDTIKGIIEKKKGLFDRIVAAAATLVANKTTKENLYETLVEKFGDEYIPIPKVDIDNFANKFLFVDKSAPPEQLNATAYKELGLKTIIKAELKDRVWRMPRWKTDVASDVPKAK